MDLRGKDGKVEPALVQHLVSVENPEIGGVRDADDSGDCENDRFLLGKLRLAADLAVKLGRLALGCTGLPPRRRYGSVAGIEPSDAGLTTTYLRGPTTRVPA